MDISPFLVDDQLNTLRDCLLIKGRGRPKKIPHSLQCTKRLLMQLKTLCDEANKCYSDVFAWFCKLFPDTKVEQSRLIGQIQWTLTKAKLILATKGEADLETYLDASYDAYFVADELSAIEITLLELQDPELFKSVPNDITLTNGAVLQLHNYLTRNHLKFKIMVMWLNHLLSASYSEKKLFVIINKLSKECKKRRGSKKPQELQQFLMSPFQERASQEKTPDCSMDKPPNLASLEHPSVSVKIKTLEKSLKNCQDELSNMAVNFQATTEQYKTASQEISSLHQENVQLKTSRVRLLWKVSKLTKSVKRHQSVIKSKMYKQNYRLKKNNRKILIVNRGLKQKIRFLENKELKLKKEKVSLQKRKSFLSRTIKKLKETSSITHDSIAHILEENKEITITRDKVFNRFTSNVRMTIIGLQEMGIAASKCSKVIQIVGCNLFEEQINDLPSASTSSNISDEGHFLSKLQATEQILQSPTVTLHTDGTSRQRQHYLGQQVTLSDGTVVSLGFTEVASEDSDTLLSTTITLLEELSDIYCLVTDEEKNDISKQLLEKITSLMSDRAAVMQSYNKKFKSYQSTTLQTDTHTHFLYCNAHFLLGLSNSCETALKDIEKNMCSSGCALGRDALSQFKNWTCSESATARLIRTTADILGPRGDEKSGCRSEWLAYCNKEGCQSKITSYRSNRFNSLFENALAIFHHKNHIQLFLSGYTTSNNLKVKSVLADILDERLNSLLIVVGLFNIYVTNPFWNLVNSSIQYVDFHQYVQQMVQNFECWIHNPQLMLDGDCKGAFGGEFFESNASLCNEALKTPKLVLECLVKVLTKFLIVTKHQLHDFLEGGVFAKEVDEETRAALRSCPLTNLTGEHAFGDLDFSMQTKRHASLHNRSTSNMLKRNRTTAWLEGKPATELHSTLSMSRKHAKQLRQRHKHQESLVKLHIQAKIAKNEIEKREKEFKAAAEKERIINSVLQHGGPVKTIKDVSRVSVGGLEALKDQLKYLKVILGVKIKISGRKGELEAALCNYLNPDKTTSSLTELHPSSSDSDDEPSIFTYERQGQWVAVYYDSTFYIGQVIDFLSPSSAIIKFLTQTKGRNDYFRWPLSDDIAQVESTFVFRWNFDVLPISSDGRIWHVPDIFAITEAYDNIQAA